MASVAAVLALSPVAGLAAYVLSHFAVSRIGKGRAPLTDLIVAAGIGGLFAAGLALWALGTGNFSLADAAGEGLVAAIGYVGLAWCYLNFVNLNLSSLRFRLLRELRAAPQGLSEEEIVARYHADQIIARRLEQLTAGGHLRLQDQRYFIAKRSLLLAFDVLEALKLAVLGHGSLLIHGGPGAPGKIARLGLHQRILRISKIVWSYSFLRFILVGGLNTLFSFCLYSGLVLLGIPYKLALTLMSVAAQVWNFMTTGHWVFGNRRKRLFLKFICASGGIYLLNLAALTALVEVFKVGELAGQAIVIPLVITASFLINRAWVFPADGMGRWNAAAPKP